MYTYTTPTVTITLTDVEFEFVDFVRVAVKGSGKVITRNLTVEDIDTETGQASFRLTQEETAAIGAGIVSIQARIRYVDGTVSATNKVVQKIEDVIDRVVI